MTEELKRFLDKHGLTLSFKYAEEHYDKKYAFKTDLKTLEEKVDAIDVGASANIIESIKVNGVALNPVDKAVDIEVPTSTDIVKMIAESSKLERKKVTELPNVEDANPNTIYTVPKADGQENNLYIEYMLINGEWEIIGDTAPKLNDYYTKEEAELKTKEIASKVAVEETSKILEEEKYVTAVQLPTLIPTITEIDIMEMFGEMEGKQAGTIKADGTVKVYVDVADAIAEAENGDIIQLVEDVEIPKGTVIPDNVVINLNGHVMTVKEQ